MSCFQLGCSRASDDTTDDFLSASKMLLDVASETLSYTPLSGLSTATIVLSSIVGKIMTMRENDTTRRDLAERIHSLAVLIRKTTDSINDKVIKTFSKEHKDDSTAVEFVVSPELNERVERLLMTLRSIDQKADQVSNNSFIWRCLCSERNANILKSLGDEVKNAQDAFAIEGQITIEMLVNGLAGQLKSVVQGVDNIQYSQDEERNRAILESLPHADARHGSALHALKAGFLEGTRTALIEELHAWATGTNPDLREKPVYILSGVAGSGKSTIAYELAHRLDKVKILGASFFFLRGAEGLNSTRLFFSTIAYQLAHSQAALRPHIVHAAGNHVKRGVQQLEFEIDGLIKRPLLKARTDTRPVVIIIDAVDECTEDAQTLVPRMLHLLLKCMLEISFPLRVLITTRPELHIEHALESVRFAHITKLFKLHDIPRLTVDEDIRHYLKTRIQAISWSAELLNERPDVVSALTERAEGLFIYAKLAIDFLSSDPGFVEENLNILLSENPSNGTAALDQLDKLYITVLDKAFPNIDREEAIRDPMRRILGCIALLQDHISPNVLASVIGMKVRRIQSILGRLGAIIVYDACDLDAKIHYLHASFPQFLLDRRRCASAAFRVDATVQHRNLAVACLSVMVKDGVLCRNVCRLSDPLLCKDRIEDISVRVETHIPLHVQYACLHWATHLCDADRDTELADLLRIFGAKKLLFWLEALSMMGRLDVAVLALLKARDWCERHDETRELLNDGYRFVLEYYVPIDSCPEHIYVSALLWIPSCRLLRIYSDMADSSIIVSPKRASHWGACLRVIEGHRREFFSLQFSSDGRWIVSGCDDGTVLTWDSRTGTALKSMQSGLIDMVCVSRDDCCMLSADRDEKVVQVWNAASGALLHQLDVHDDVLFVAYAPDGRILVAVPTGLQTWRDHTDRLPETATYPSYLPSSSYRGIETVSIHFSPDGSKMVLLLIKEVAYLWDGQSHAFRHILEGHTNAIYSAAFFPDGSKVVTAAGDSRLRIWAVESGDCLQTLPGHTKGAWCVAVSSRGDRIASGGGDCTVRLWDAISLDCIAVLKGHIDPVLSLAFSPNGDRVASASLDTTIRIWDITESDLGDTPTPHAARISSVAFSPDGTLAASGSADKTVKVWKTTNDELVQHFPCDEEVRDVCFSTSAQQIVVVGPTSMATWNISAGTCEAVINEALTDVACSFDGNWIAGFCPSGPSMTVTVWKVPELSVQWSFKFSISPSPIVDSMFKFGISADCTRVYVTNSRDAVRVRDCASGRVVQASHSDVETMAQEALLRHKFYEENGWIILRESGRRLCWLPPSRRPHEDPRTYRKSFASYENKVAIGGTGGHFSILNLAKVIEEL